MRRLSRASLALVLTLAILPVNVWAADKVFDDHADPEHDLQVAQGKAAQEHKLVLVDLGANWCPGCIEIDGIMHSDVGIEKALQGFVVVHISVGGIFRKNKAAIAIRERYPTTPGIPYLLVLTSEGKFLCGSDGDGLTDDRKHNHISTQMIVDFLNGSLASVASSSGKK